MGSIKKGKNSTIFHSSLLSLFCVGHFIRIGLNIYEVIQVVSTGSSQMNNIILVDLSHFLLLFNSSFNVCLIAVLDKTTRDYFKGLFKWEEHRQPSESHYSLLFLDIKEESLETNPDINE